MNRWTDVLDLLRDRIQRDARGRTGMRGNPMPGPQTPKPQIPPGVTVPQSIRQGNPNIDRALNYDIGQTNPHAAGLLKDLQPAAPPRNGLGSDGTADAIATAFRKELAKRNVTTAPVGQNRMPSSGGGTLADMNRALSEMFTPKSASPDADTLAGSIRGSLGATSAQDRIRQEVESVSRGMGLSGVGDIPSLADAITKQVRGSLGQQTSGGFPNAGGVVNGTPGNAPMMDKTPLAGGNGRYEPPTAFPAEGQRVGSTQATQTYPGSPTPFPSGGQRVGSTAAPPAGDKHYMQNQDAIGVVAPTNGTGGVGAPSGTIPSNLNIAYGRGGDWGTVNQYDPLYVQYGQQYGVDPAMLKAMAVIETGGQMIPNQNGSGAYGIMQIKEGDWGWLANQIGADLSTPEGQIATAAAILGQYGTGSTPEERFINSYYPTGCLDCPGEDGHTPRQYLDDMYTLMGIINGAGTAVAGGPGTGGAPNALPAAGPGTGGTGIPGAIPGQPLPVGSNAPLGAPAIPGSDIYRNPPLPVGSNAPLGAPAIPGSDIRLGGGSTTPVDGSPLPGKTSDEMVGPATNPRVPIIGTGVYTPVAAPDGIGVMASPDSDETWIQQMSPGSYISTEYKGPAPGPWYDYQIGHGATNQEHAAYDIAAEEGSALNAPVSGTVLCSGYGQGSGAYGSCTWSEQTTWNNPDGSAAAHTIVLDIGTDAAGNSIQLSFNHVGTSNLQPGQTVNAGDLLGTVGSGACTDGAGNPIRCPHTHVEAWGWCAKDQTFYMLDTTLVLNGYYSQNPVC